jgi:ankyrin repeat protein
MLVELFNSEITQTICTQKLLCFELVGTTLCKPNREQLEEYIFRHAIMNDTTERNASSTINAVLGTLLAAGGELCLNDRNSHIRALTSRLVEYRGTNVISCLQPDSVNTEAFSNYIPQTLTRNNTHAAAAHLGQTWYFQRTCSWDIEHFQRSYYFGSPLACAARRGHVDIVQLLLDRMLEMKRTHPRIFKPEIQYKSRFSLALFPIGEASAGGHVEVLDLIFDPKYGFCLSSKQIRDAILKAAQNGHVRVIERLLPYYNLDHLQAYNLILSEGAHRNQPKVVQFALANGADSNKRCVHRGAHVWPPLSLATIRGHQSMAELLLSYGTNLKCRNMYEKWTTDPLGIAARRGYKKLVKLFVENGAPSENYSAALIMASEAGQADMVVYLLSGEAGMNFSTDTCRIGLEKAKENEWLSVAQLLEKHLHSLEKISM